MKNISAILFTEKEEANFELINLLQSLCNLSVCKYTPDIFSAVDLYSPDNALFIFDYFNGSSDSLNIFSKLYDDGIFFAVPVLFTSSEVLTCFEENGFTANVCDILPESFDRETIRHRIENLFEIYNSKQQVKNITKIHTKRILNQANKLKEQKTRMETMNFDLVELLVATIESRDLESGQHIKRIRYFTKALTDVVAKNCPEYNITPEYAEYIYFGSSVHDIGKISIPDSILLKPGRLTEEEFEIMKTHTVNGAKLIDMLVEMNDNIYFRQCKEICVYHHEKWDGKGYPYGLKGDDIPISAQIVSVCDCYDALTSERPYKRAFSHDEAVDMILNGSCGSFSPQLMKCFTEALPEFKRIGNQLKNNDSVKDDSLIKNFQINDKIADKSTNKNLELPKINPVENNILGSFNLIFDADLLNDKLRIVRGSLTGYFDTPPKNFEELLISFSKICIDDDLSLFSNRFSLNYFTYSFKNNHKKLRVEFRVSDGDDVKTISGNIILNGNDGILTNIIGSFNDYSYEEILKDTEAEKAETDLTSGLKHEKFVVPEIEKHLLSENNTKNVLIYIDIDNMNMVNNLFGYSFGNELIKEFGNKLALLENSKVIISKPKADKFIVFIKDVKNQIEVINYIEKIRSSLHKVYHTTEKNVTFTVSMGISRYPEDGTTYSDLRNAAEFSSRIAKSNGNGSYIFYKKDMINIASFSEENRFANGFNADFTPCFVPVSDIKTGKIQYYDFVPFSLFSENSVITPDKFYEMNKSYEMGKSVSLLSVETLLFNLINQKNSGIKIPPISIYTIVKADDINSFVHTLKSFAEENDFSDIDICILFPQDVAEQLSEKKLTNISEVFKQIGFSLGLYLVGKKYIHNLCFKPGIFKRFVLCSDYFELNSSLGFSFDYVSETISKLNNFAETVSVPVELPENIISKFKNENNADVSHSLKPINGIENFLEIIRK